MKYFLCSLFLGCLASASDPANLPHDGVPAPFKFTSPAFATLQATLGQNEDEADPQFQAILEQSFSDFAHIFGKNYSSPTDKDFRKDVFLSNVRKIAKMNQENSSVTYDINQFADITPEEFQEQLRLHSNVNVEHFHRDITRFGLVNEKEDQFPRRGTAYPNRYPFTQQDEYCQFRVRDQGPCGSCWAFGVTEVFQATHCKATGEKLELAPQTLLDCDQEEEGCGGAYSIDGPLKFAIENKGLCTEADYPYTAVEDKCDEDCKRHGSSLLSVLNLSQSRTPDVLAEAVHKLGALVIGVDATNFQFYRSGVLKKEDCVARAINHAVSIVGYNLEDGETPYFMIKNSWGERWGDQGYIRLEFGACGFGSMVYGSSAKGIHFDPKTRFTTFMA